MARSHSTSPKGTSRLHIVTRDAFWFVAPWNFIPFGSLQDMVFTVGMKDLLELDHNGTGTDQLLSEYLDSDPAFWLLDGNAAPGPSDGTRVFCDGLGVNSNTCHLRDLLEKWIVCLPATGEIHSGDRTAWTSIGGDTQHCIDTTQLATALRSFPSSGSV